VRGQTVAAGACRAVARVCSTLRILAVYAVCVYTVFALIDTLVAPCACFDSSSVAYYVCIYCSHTVCCTCSGAIGALKVGVLCRLCVHIHSSCTDRNSL
jgi:hypothetical protein